MIWLLRHAEAADGVHDAERPLTEHGEQQARAAGAAMVAMGVQVDACIASPKVRATDTARLACAALGVTVEIDAALEGGPFDPEAVAAGRENVLLVGHDPDFSMAVHRLTGAQVRMSKGGLAGVDRGELAALLRPDDLAAICF
jgi:phosphohistidine phosphatase